MSRRIGDDALEALHLRIRAEVKRKEPPHWVSVPGRDLMCIIDELRRRRTSDGRSGAFKLSPTTRTLLMMKEGDVCFLPPTTIGAITSARKTARKHLDNPNAVWACQTLESGNVRVERMPDGSEKHYGLPKNPAIEQIAPLLPGESVVIQGSLYAALKQQVRKKMGVAGLHAQWISRTLTKGRTKVTRTK